MRSNGKVTGSPELSGRYSPQAAALVAAFFMFKVYIIYSKVLDQYYVGFSGNLEDRLFRHNNSGSKSTKRASDWTLVYEESYATRSEAMKREQEIKGKKSRQYIDLLIEKRK